MNFFQTLFGIYAVICGIWLLIVIITLITISRRRDLYKPEKLVWSIVILFAPVLGLVLYFIYGKRKKRVTRQVKGER